jgi:hypothetical protein
VLGRRGRVVHVPPRSRAWSGASWRRQLCLGNESDSCHQSVVGDQIRADPQTVARRFPGVTDVRPATNARTRTDRQEFRGAGGAQDV